jgi:hypothetical protein
MTTDILFPFYEILVNNIFGNVLVSLFALGIILWMILAISKTSQAFVIYWLLFYFMVMGTAYLGAIGLVFSFIITFTYFVVALLRFVAGVWINI